MSLIESFSRETARLSRPILLSGHFSNWRALRKQRKSLSRLDSRALEDIGLTRHEAQQEARRPFWDVPESWRN